MKKRTKTILWSVGIVLFILLVIFGLFKFGIARQTSYQGTSTFTPVYCNSYEFNSCAETGQNGGTPTSQLFTFTSASQSVQCPLGATTKCVINSINNGGNSFSMSPILYSGSLNCGIKSTFFGLGQAFLCDNGQQVFATQTIGRNSFLYAYQGNPAITYTIYEQHLFFTGTSFATGGVPVQGADGCTFQTDKSIYDSNGNVVKQASGSTLSYTVPTNQAVLSWTGVRSICGNLEEQCTSDTSCGGHTYGNQECSARTLQTYGCKQLNLPTGVTNTGGTLIGSTYAVTDKNNNSINVNQYSGVTARCDIQSAKQVQCCGDTDCGSGAVCDTTPSSTTAWTCKIPSQVQCRQNSDCGVSTQCNIATKQLVTPTCVAGVCQQSNTKQVACCSSQDCATGSFCDTDYTCKQSSNPLVNTPFECSPRANTDDKTKYFDKPCPTGKVCTQAGTCQDVSNVTNQVSNIGRYTFWIVFVIATIIIFLISFFKIKPKNMYARIGIALLIGIISGIIIGLIVAFLVALISGVLVKIGNFIRNPLGI